MDSQQYTHTIPRTPSVRNDLADPRGPDRDDSRPACHPRLAQEGGFSLVEIMVAVLIGMVAILVIMQVFQASEGRKRTATSGADAQTSGAVSLFMLERDLRMSGWGLNPQVYLGSFDPLIPANNEPGCTTTQTYCNGNAACGGTAGALAGFSWAPVQITDGGAAAPDTVTAQYFGDPTDGATIPMAPINFGSDAGAPADTLTVTNTMGCATGNMMVLSDRSNATCTLEQVSTLVSSTVIEHKAVTPKGVFNNPAGWAVHPTSAARIACFKAAPDGPFYHRIYRVDTTEHRLLRTDNSAVPAVIDETVAANIMDLQAQYGVSSTTVGDQAISSWVDATGATWATPTMANIRRIKAIRIAILARSDQYEKPGTSVCTATTATMAANWSSWATFNTATFPANWQCYRYRVFETVIPLRNVIWARV